MKNTDQAVVIFLMVIIVAIATLVISEVSRINHRKGIITAIQDNGCAKPTTIEIKPDVSNAEAYNYKSLGGK